MSTPPVRISTLLARLALAVTASALLMACASSDKASKVRTAKVDGIIHRGPMQFKVWHEGAALTCFEASLSGREAFYMLYRDGRFMKLVERPVMAVGESPTAKVLRVLRAPAVAPGKVKALAQNGVSPPAMSAPLIPVYTVSASVHAQPRSAMIYRIERAGITLGTPWETAVERASGMNARMDADRGEIRFGPGVPDAEKSALITFRGGVVNGIYTKAFYEE